MQTIEKYLLTDTEHDALKSCFTPLAFLMSDETKAHAIVSRLHGNMMEYSAEQRQELIDAVHEVCTQLRRQASVHYWGEMPHADGLAQMRHTEYVKLFAVLLMLTNE